MPTFACNLKCAHCCARTLPMDKYKGHLTADQWIKIFSDLQEPVDLLCIGGREPSLYSGLTEVLRSLPWHFAIDTNVVIHPQEWLTPDLYDRCDYVNPSLQFRPDHPRAEPEFWSRLRWLSENMPQRTQIYISHVMTQHAHPIEEQQVLDEIAKLGDDRIKHVKLGFDDTFMYRERVPIQPGMAYESCSSGKDVIVVFPDGSVFRCIGHAYYDIDCLGNLVTDGWDVLLKESQPCDQCLCTICDAYVEKVPVGTSEPDVEVLAATPATCCEEPVVIAVDVPVEPCEVPESCELDIMIGGDGDVCDPPISGGSTTRQNWVGFKAEDVVRWGVCEWKDLIAIDWSNTAVTVIRGADGVEIGLGVLYDAYPPCQNEGEPIPNDMAHVNWHQADDLMRTAAIQKLPWEWQGLISAITAHEVEGSTVQ